MYFTSGLSNISDHAFLLLYLIAFATMVGGKKQNLTGYQDKACFLPLTPIFTQIRWRKTSI